MIIPEKPQTGIAIPRGWYLNVWSWIRSMYLSGSKYIKVTHDSGGQSVVLNFTKLQDDLYQSLSGGGAGDTYNGYLKAVKTSATKIKIVDGFDADAENCWEGMVNKFNCVCPAEEITITGDAWIYAQAVSDGGTGTVDDPWTGATVSIEQSSSKPTWESAKWKRLISRITFAGGNITKFTQEHGEMNGIMMKECST